MRAIRASLALLLLAACGRAEGGTLKFDSERIDLGILPQYSEKEFSVPFRVEGGEAVRLDSLEVSCGCTDVSVVVDGKVLLLAEKKATPTATGLSLPLPKEDDDEALTAHAGEQEILLPPGTRGEVRGTYRPERRLNEQIVTIQLRGSMLNAPVRAELRAVMEPIFRLEPERIVFGSVVDSALRAQAQTREVVVRTARPFTLSGWRKVPSGLRIEDLGVETAAEGTTGSARRFRFTLDTSAPRGVVEQLVSAGTDLGADLDLLVAWRVLGPAIYAPEQRLQFMPVPHGREHERVVKILPSLPEIQLPEPRAEVLGDAAPLLRVSVEPLAGEASGWQVRCVLSAETEPGAYAGTLRIAYPDGAELATHEMVVNIRVLERR